MNCLLLKSETDSERFAEGSAKLSETSDAVFRKNIVVYITVNHESERQNIAYSEHSKFSYISPE